MFTQKLFIVVIHIYQKQETTQMYFNWWMDKQWYVHSVDTTQ